MAELGKCLLIHADLIGFRRQPQRKKTHGTVIVSCMVYIFYQDYPFEQHPFENKDSEVPACSGTFLFGYIVTSTKSLHRRAGEVRRSPRRTRSF